MEVYQQKLNQLYGLYSHGRARNNNLKSCNVGTIDLILSSILTTLPLLTTPTPQRRYQNANSEGRVRGWLNNRPEGITSFLEISTISTPFDLYDFLGLEAVF